jgi:23S rRNA pseudouridine1911/1915/1917 synthase
VMILANNPGALVELLRQFRVREVAKMYTCLVHGKFQITEDTLHLPLGRSTDNRTKFSIDASGRLAETHYKVAQFYSQVDIEAVMVEVVTTAQSSGIAPQKNMRKKLQKGYQGFSLVQCWPKTGRTHQIRVHMSAIQHPIVSDETYLGKKRQSMDALWCSRLFLHATELEIMHPRTKEKMKFDSKIPLDLQAALSKLKE